jgi:hypothetical protein
MVLPFCRGCRFALTIDPEKRLTALVSSFSGLWSGQVFVNEYLPNAECRLWSFLGAQSQ